MPEPRDPLAQRMRALPGLVTLVAEAEQTWRDRAASVDPAASDSLASDSLASDSLGADSLCSDSLGSDSLGSESARPGWRTFEDAFPTFYEFTNRPR